MRNGNFKATEKLIRPIVLVQAERTGKDQRDAGFVHSEAVKEYLMQRLGVPEAAIAIKTAETDDIEGIDLMAEDCPVEWIITKAALQEGWDCPFAYILVSLNNTGSQQSMTQLVGRVLRQPYVERTPFEELNESYVFCLQRKAADIAREVKNALEKEGYEGAAASVVDRSDAGGKPAKRTASVRAEFRRYYQAFEGRIYPAAVLREAGQSLRGPGLFPPSRQSGCRGPLRLRPCGQVEYGGGTERSKRFPVSSDSGTR